VENKWKITIKKTMENTLILIYIDFFVVTKIAKNRQEFCTDLAYKHFVRVKL